MYKPKLHYKTKTRQIGRYTDHKDQLGLLMSGMASGGFQAYQLSLSSCIIVNSAHSFLLASPCSFILLDKTTYCTSDNINAVDSLWIVGNTIGTWQ